MALSAKHRSTIYERLSPMLGEEEVEALLSQFPSRDLDEPVTKDFVRAEIAEVRSELAGMRTDLRGEIASLRTDLRGEIADLRTELHTRLRELTMWMAGALVAGMAVAAAISSLVG